MQHLEAEAKKLKHQNSIWNTLEFLCQWGIPSMTGIGIGIGISMIAIDKPTRIDAIFLSIGFFGLLFQFLFGFSAISLITHKKTELSKKQVELQKQIESAKKIHLQLDEHRDAMLFDQCDKYWKLLDKLNI